MKQWQKGAIGAGIVGLYFGAKELVNRYLDNKLKEVSVYPAPEGTSILGKMKLISKSPYKKIQI